MIIKVRNLLDQTAQNSFLSNSEATGVGTIRIKNINSFQASWAIQIGKTGEEQSEIKVLGTATPSGTSLVLTGTTNYDHPSDTPVYAIKYDKLIFKRSTSGTAGTATALTNGTVSITPDSVYTQFDDTSAASGYAYKASFYNTVTTEESSNSDWLTTSGFSFYSQAGMRDRIKNKLFSAGYIKSDSVIDGWMNEWLEVMDRAAIKVNQGYSMGTVGVAFGTNGLGTITTTGFKELERVWITYDGVESFKATKKDQSEVFPNEVFNKTHPYYSWRGDKVFEVLPAETGGTANLNIYQRTTQLVNDGDELPLVMQTYSNSFVNYAVSEAYYIDDKSDMGDRYFARAKTEKDEFIAEITPRNFTNVQTIDIDYVMNAEEDVFL